MRIIIPKLDKIRKGNHRLHRLKKIVGKHRERVSIMTNDY